MLAKVTFETTCWLVGRGSVNALVSNSISSRELLVGTKESFMFASVEIIGFVLEWTTPPVAPDSKFLSGANTESHHVELTRCDAILYHFIQYLICQYVLEFSGNEM
jgi:hypothetical protein